MTRTPARAKGVTAAWLVAVFVLWPAWYWLMQRVAVVPVVWFVNLVPSEPTSGEGPFDRTQVVALAAIGFAFGFLGVYLLRLLRAPRLVWVPAAIMSVLIYLAGTAFWASFSGYGTGPRTSLCGSRSRFFWAP